ncbi:MAG: hypothetical protein H5T85_05475, partial [Actinobacteria bacterium]|nr:hypothetical protein [Actinomycetota bacterium]
MEIEAPKIFILAYEKSRDYYDFLREYKNLGLRFEEITLSDLEKKDTDQSSDILVVFSQDPGWLDTTLTNLRKRFTTSLSLILAISSANYENENRLADDVLTFPTESKLIEEKIQSCISMTLKIGSLTGILDSLDEDRKRAVTLLRFIYTRNKMELKPKPNKLSPTNYYYPPANIFLNTNPGEEIEKLETLEKMGMLSGEVVDRVYLCPSCLTASIRLRELCPSCDSIEIEKIVAMRHEYCSYTGDEEDFKKPQLGIYVCPKCKEEISPDEVKKSKFPAFLCQFCGNIFKEPEKKFTCSSCKNDYSYEHLLIKDIKSYSITAEGIKAAEDGILYDFSEREAIFEGEKALLKDQVFKEIFYLEMARSTRYKRPFCLARVRVVDFENIVNIRGEEKAKRISEELFSLMYKNLRRTDVLTTIEPGIFLILFLETPVDGTESALRKIKKEVDKVFGEAIKISWEVIYESKEREREKDLQKDLQSVNSNIMA